MARASSPGPHGQEAARREGPSEGAILRPLTVADCVRLAAEVLSTYVEVRRLLRRGDLPSTVRALRERVPSRGWAEPGVESYWQGIRLAKATTRTLALLPADTRCLMQSLVLLSLLSRRGIGNLLIVAVSSEPDFGAHAWIEHNELPLLPTGNFGRLVEL